MNCGYLFVVGHTISPGKSDTYNNNNNIYITMNCGCLFVVGHTISPGKSDTYNNNNIYIYI